jgi:SAM-dependent methyltransferase
VTTGRRPGQDPAVRPRLPWARYYARHSSFARTAAPRVRELYEATYGAATERNVLDVRCGVGTLAEHFLSQGYTVTGVDLSEPMLAAGQRPGALARVEAELPDPAHGQLTVRRRSDHRRRERRLGQTPSGQQDAGRPRGRR